MRRKKSPNNAQIAAIKNIARNLQNARQHFEKRVFCDLFYVINGYVKAFDSNHSSWSERKTQCELKNCRIKDRLIDKTSEKNVNKTQRTNRKRGEKKKNRMQLKRRQTKTMCNPQLSIYCICAASISTDKLYWAYNRHVVRNVGCTVYMRAAQVRMPQPASAQYF